MNNDLISRSALLELAHNHVGRTVDCNDIARFPAVDTEVVRCKDCKHTIRSKVSPEKIICCLTKMCGTVDPDYFCADGEREIDAEVEG